MGGWAETMPSLRGDDRGGMFSAYFPLHIAIQDTGGHDHWTWIYVGSELIRLRDMTSPCPTGPNFGLPLYIRLVRERAGNEE